MSSNSSVTSIVVAVVVLIIGVFALAFWPSSDDGSSVAHASINGELEFSETRWDIGDVSMKDGLDIREVEVTNSTSNPITITSIETSCMCTKAQVVHSDGKKSGLKGMVGHGGTPKMNETIEAGETATMRIVYDPNAHGPDATGPISREVMIGTNSSDQSQVKLSFMGNVTK